MVVEFRFAKGGVGALHSHPHLQSTYVQSGKFEFTIGTDRFEVSEGDSFIIPRDTPHGCHAIEAGTLVDTFTPHREDFL